MGCLQSLAAPSQKQASQAAEKKADTKPKAQEMKELPDKLPIPTTVHFVSPYEFQPFSVIHMTKFKKDAGFLKYFQMEDIGDNLMDITLLCMERQIKLLCGFNTNEIANYLSSFKFIEKNKYFYLKDNGKSGQNNYKGNSKS